MLDPQFRPGELSPSDYVNARRNALIPVMINSECGVVIVHFAAYPHASDRVSAPPKFAVRGLATVLDIHIQGDEAWNITMQRVDVNQNPVGAEVGDIMSGAGIIVSNAGLAEKYLLSISQQ